MKRTVRILVLPALALLPGAAAEVEAVVGAPFTPLSYAGTSRRVARRTARRTSARVAAATTPAPVVVAPAPVVVAPATASIGTAVASIPDGAKTLTVDGKTYYESGGVYYQPFYNGPTVVYMVVANPL